MEAKERILKSAEDLFLRYGIKSITMDDIARQLGMSKKTLYQFFKDKDEIVYLVCQSHLEQDACKIKEFKALSQNALEEFIMISEHFKSEMQKMNPSLLYDLQKFHSKGWSVFEDHKANIIIGTVMENLHRGIKEGFYRDDINVEILARLRIEQVQLGFNQAIFPPDEFVFREVQIQFMDHFIRGLLTKKGFELLEEINKKNN